MNNKLLSLESSSEGVEFIDGHIMLKTTARFTGGEKHVMYMTSEAYEALRKSAGLIRDDERGAPKHFIHPRVHEFQPLEPVTFTEENYGQ